MVHRSLYLQRIGVELGIGGIENRRGQDRMSKVVADDCVLSCLAFCWIHSMFMIDGPAVVNSMVIAIIFRKSLENEGSADLQITEGTQRPLRNIPVKGVLSLRADR